MSATSRSLRELDGQERLFVASLCLSDADLETLGFRAREGGDGCAGCGASSPAVLRCALQRLCATDAPLARAVADLLDVRHLATVWHARTQEPARGRRALGRGERLIRAWCSLGTLLLRRAQLGP